MPPHDPPVRTRLVAAAAAVAIAFAAAGALFLRWGVTRDAVTVTLITAAPAAAVAMLPFRARLFCFAWALLALGGASLLDTRGADNPLSIVPLLAFFLVVDVLVAELCLRLAGWARHRRGGAGALLEDGRGG